MQTLHVVPITAVLLNVAGPAVLGWTGYSPNVSPASAAVELVTDSYFLWATS